MQNILPPLARKIQGILIDQGHPVRGVGNDFKLTFRDDATDADKAKAQSAFAALNLADLMAERKRLSPHEIKVYVDKLDDAALLTCLREMLIEQVRREPSWATRRGFPVPGEVAVASIAEAVAVPG